MASLLMIQAVAVVAIVITKRFHDDSMLKDKPPGQTFTTVMHYLKYPLLLWSLEFKRDTDSNKKPDTPFTKDIASSKEEVVRQIPKNTVVK